MSLAELIPDIRSLPVADKARLMHLLTQELSEADPAALLVPGQAYPIWSPFAAALAADALLKLLDAEQGRP